MEASVTMERDCARTEQCHGWERERHEEKSCHTQQTQQGGLQYMTGSPTKSRKMITSPREARSVPTWSSDALMPLGWMGLLDVDLPPDLPQTRPSRTNPRTSVFQPLLGHQLKCRGSYPDIPKCTDWGTVCTCQYHRFSCYIPPDAIAMSSGPGSCPARTIILVLPVY